jgi:hypothetical protein
MEGELGVRQKRFGVSALWRIGVRRKRVGVLAPGGGKAGRFAYATPFLLSPLVLRVFAL